MIRIGKGLTMRGLVKDNVSLDVLVDECSPGLAPSPKPRTSLTNSRNIIGIASIHSSYFRIAIRELSDTGSNQILLWPPMEKARLVDLLHPGRKRYGPSLVMKITASKVANKKPTRIEP